MKDAPPLHPDLVDALDKIAKGFSRSDKQKLQAAKLVEDYIRKHDCCLVLDADNDNELSRVTEALHLNKALDIDDYWYGTGSRTPFAWVNLRKVQYVHPIRAKCK